MSLSIKIIRKYITRFYLRLSPAISRPAKTLKSTYDGIFCHKLAIMLESIGMVHGLRQTRLPSQHLTYKVKLQGQKVKQGLSSASTKSYQLLISYQIQMRKNA